MPLCWLIQISFSFAVIIFENYLNCIVCKNMFQGFFIVKIHAIFYLYLKITNNTRPNDFIKFSAIKQCFIKINIFYVL